MSSDDIIHMLGMAKSFGAVEVLTGIDMKVRRGEAAFIIGPSGSGKSTLLRCVNGLETYSGGELWVEDYLVGAENSNGKWYEARSKVTAARRAGIGMVFQRFNLFPNMTALENVTAGLRLVLGQPRRQADARGRELLDRVGLLHRADAYPAQLSGGQQQRIAIARAIAAKPSIIANQLGVERRSRLVEQNARRHPRDRLRRGGRRHPSISSTAGAWLNRASPLTSSAIPPTHEPPSFSRVFASSPHLSHV